jgi:type II secretory pathway component GspD/PulD (secretin)
MLFQGKTYTMGHSMKTPVKIGWLLLAWLVFVLPLHAETVTLNLKDADIGALISTVAEVTDRNFIVDPRVKGKVTVISTRAMDADEVYQVFLSISMPSRTAFQRQVMQSRDAATRW